MRINIKLLSPLAHGAFDVGADTNVMALRRFPLLVDGQSVEVPALSGNALRGRIRRTLMRSFLTALGITAEHPKWDRIYGMAVNGGTISGPQDTTINPARIRDVRAALPPLSVLGAACYSWFLPSRVSVGICWPICDLTVQAGVVDPSGHPVPALADVEGEVQHTRLPDRDVAATEDLKPMPHGVEVINAGVVLQSEILFAPEATDHERSAIIGTVIGLDALGGQGAKGLGRVHIDSPDGVSAVPAWTPAAASVEILESLV